MTDASTKPTSILGWHCHIYFKDGQRDIAAKLNEQIQDRYKVWDYRWLDESNFLHPLPMFRFQFEKAVLADFIEWIVLNREGLSVLVHAITGDDIYDHSYNAMWLGEPLHLDLDALKEMQAKIARGELPKELAPASQVGAENAATGRFKPGDDQHGSKS